MSNTVFSGTSGNDSITGTDNNDTLDGGLGRDTLNGGNGNDLYIIDNKSDKIIETSLTDIDSVQSTISYTLGKNLENLKLLGAANINATGNALNNLLEGNNGNNKLSGSTGNDTLIGGLGVDKLAGGKGSDTFTFTSLNDSGLTSKTYDTITDFKHTDGDKIDLSELGISKFIGTQAFSTTNATGQLRFDAKTHMLYGSTNADAQPEFSILLSGVKSLSAEDFILSNILSLTATGININEGGSVTYTATLTSAAPTGGLNIPYTLTGTGITTSDFNGLAALTGNINVPAGATTGTLVLNVANDVTTEGAETLSIALGTVSGVTLGTITTASTVIADTSLTAVAVVPTVSLTANATNINEGGSVTYTATLTSAAPTGGLNIPYTLSGTGISTSDFTGLTALTGNLNVPAGTTTGTLVLNVANDVTTEGVETLSITLGTVAGVTLGTSTTASTMIADTSVPTVITGVTSTLVAGGSVATSTVADVFKLAAATSSYTTTVTNGFNYLVDKIQVPTGSTLPSAIAGGVNDVTDGNVDLTWANNNNVVTISLTGLSAVSEAAIQLNAVSDTIFGTY